MKYDCVFKLLNEQGKEWLQRAVIEGDNVEDALERYFKLPDDIPEPGEFRPDNVVELSFKVRRQAPRKRKIVKRSTRG